MKRTYWAVRSWLASIGLHLNPVAKRREVRWLSDAKERLAAAIADEVPEQAASDTAGSEPSVGPDNQSQRTALTPKHV